MWGQLVSVKHSTDDLHIDLVWGSFLQLLLLQVARKARSSPKRGCFSYQRANPDAHFLVPSYASFPAPFSPPRQPPPPLTSPPRRPSLLLLSPPRPSPPLCSGRRPLSPPLAGLRHGPHPLAGTAPSSPDGRAAPSSLPRWSAPPRAPSLDGRRPAPLELPPSTTSASRSHASGGLLSPSLEVGGGARAPDPARGGAGASRTSAGCRGARRGAEGLYAGATALARGRAGYGGARRGQPGPARSARRQVWHSHQEVGTAGGATSPKASMAAEGKHGDGGGGRRARKEGGDRS